MDTAENRFADCCSAGPLELMIERVDDGAVVARGGLSQPFALIGRDPYCDIHLNDPVVALRHALLQVLGGSVFVVDLASTTGVHWSTGRQTAGWLIPGEPLRIGPFRLFLTRSASSNPTVLLPEFHPLTSSEAPAAFPRTILEFRTGRPEKQEWEVNRILTLVGRASECKLHLAGEDIALFHSYFVKTVAGLWVVDLLARGGTRVNEKKVRVALLQHGDELLIGKFGIGVSYPKVTPRLAGSEDSAVSFDVAGHGSVAPLNSDLLSVASSARIGQSPDTQEADLATLTPAPPDDDLRPQMREMLDLQRTTLKYLQDAVAVMSKLLKENLPPPEPSEPADREALLGRLLGKPT